MTPDMDNVPEFIAVTLAAAPIFAEKGIKRFNPEQPDHGSGIVVHDFGEGAKAGVEAAHASLGFCFVITPFDDGKVTDQVRGGAVHFLNFTLHAQETPGTNRGQNGTGIRCDKAILEAAKILLKAQWPGNFPRSLVVGTFRNLGEQGSVWACTLSVGMQVPLL